MIYCILSKKDSELQKKIINFIKEQIKYNNFDYKLIFIDGKHIVENQLKDISFEKDFVFWNPYVAGSNLEIVKQYLNSIVILDKPTVLIQKLSEENPINENLAINNGFYIIYINPEKSDSSNDEWKLVVQKEMYLLTLEQLIDSIKNGDESNHKKEKIRIPDIFDDIVDDISKTQIYF